MSLKNLEKLKIVYGNDMYPSIDPNEMLFLDRKRDPEVGDVILFKNKFGMRIAHRLLYEFGSHYFTKGDNCRCFNFPIEKDRIVGVIAGKKVPVIRSRVGELLLALFLPYFMAYSKLFGLKKKKWFILLNIASRFYPYLPPPEQQAKVR